MTTVDPAMWCKAIGHQSQHLPDVEVCFYSGAMPAPVIAVFGASKPSPGDGAYADGVTCGRLLAEAGYGVVTGGYGGIMEAVSLGAGGAGGKVVGVTVPRVFADRSGANEYVAEERQAPGLVERIAEMTELSAGSIVLPGSIGTLAEFGVAWNLAFISRFSDSVPKPLVAVGSIWREVVGHLADRLDTDDGLVTLVESATEAVEAIRHRVPVI